MSTPSQSQPPSHLHVYGLFIALEFHWHPSLYLRWYSWAPPHKDVGTWWLFSRFPAKSVSLTPPHWRHQLACQLTTQLVTQSIHTRVSRHLLKPAENPLSFPLLVLICPGINLKRNFTEMCCCCCTYSLSWVCFRKSFGGFCLGRIFITLPGRRIQDRAPRM